MSLTLKLELIGIVFIFLAGSAFHFIYEWTGFLKPMAFIGAVNESTWEHLKLAFWPGVLFALIEYPLIKNEVNNFWLAKCIGLFIMSFLIVIIFYGYTAITGKNYLIADISTFFVAVALGQLSGYIIMTAPPMNAISQWLGILGLLIQTTCFSLFTYFPPHTFLFKDPHTHQYGIMTRHLVNERHLG